MKTLLLAVLLVCMLLSTQGMKLRDTHPNFYDTRTPEEKAAQIAECKRKCDQTYGSYLSTAKVKCYFPCS